MPRKRIIPIMSKTKKFFYIISVKLNGDRYVKLGISSNYVRRIRQYRNEKHNGYLLDIHHVYKCKHPERVEHMVKWVLSSKYRSIKQEYYNVEHMEEVDKEFHKAVKYLKLECSEVDFTSLKS